MRMADPTESLPDAHEQFFSKGDTTDDVGIDHVHREYNNALVKLIIDPRCNVDLHMQVFLFGEHVLPLGMRNTLLPIPFSAYKGPHVLFRT